MKIEVQEGIPMCTEVRIAARPLARSDGKGGLTYKFSRGLGATDVEAIDLANWIEDILSECTWHLGPEGLTSRPGTKEGRDAIRQAQKASRRKVSPDLLAEVAEIYRANLDQKPLEALRDELGLQYRTAARYVQMCRSDEFQLLPKTQRGKRKA